MEKIFRIWVCLLALALPILSLSQANSNLSNLSSTAINESLLPGSDNAIDLGTDLFSYRNLFMKGIFTAQANVVGNNGTNCFLSNHSMTALTTGGANAFLGKDSGLSISTGSDNTGLGSFACRLASTATGNTCVGNRAGIFVNGVSNTLVGSEAGNALNSGETNTMIGLSSGKLTNSGFSNVFVGANAGQNTTSGSANVMVGVNAGLQNATGTKNTLVGSSANVNLAGDLTNANALGASSVISISNGMNFGSASTLRWGFGISLAGIPNTKAFIVGSGTANGNGGFLTSGGTWTNASSRSFKDRITEIDSEQLMSEINRLNISKWAYKGTDEFHIGPMAEEFYAAFETGVDAQSISTIDPAGVSLAAIQLLNKELNERLALLEEMQRNIEVLETKMHQEDLCASDLQSHMPLSEKPLLEFVEQNYSLTAQVKSLHLSEDAVILCIGESGDTLKEFRVKELNDEGKVDLSGLEHGSYCFLLCDKQWTLHSLLLEL